MSADSMEERTTCSERIAFDDDPSEKTDISPRESEHWQSLVHQENDKWIHTLEELKDRFRADLVASKSCGNNGGEIMAIWSCLSGYCEALATHKEASRRYSIFPIPMDALVRLVKIEFWDRVLHPAEKTLVNSNASPSSSASLQDCQKRHRARVRAVANAVWETALSSSKKDEEHANSLYVCLRGTIDRKSIDCLGSSVTTVAGVKLLQQAETRSGPPCAIQVTSMLTLSEDHAYEKHSIRVSEEGADGAATNSTKLEGTCEVAIPGSTKRQKDKRACEIADTFKDKKACVLLTPENSWLYMATNPVICSNTPMSLVPIIANINCNIRSNNSKGIRLESKQLYRLKRELLWILYDEGAMKEFPFGILELGDCEATAGSKRGEEWVVSKSPLIEHSEPIMRNEELFLEAAEITRRQYNDAQVYPYYYLGHYHKDAGGTEIQPESNASNENHAPTVFSDNEHRFVDALRMYSEMARVTSKYRFDTGDCLQLNKHLTCVAPLVYEDILTTKAPFSSLESPNNNKAQPRVPRKWIHDSNARACCFWMLRFLDFLLHWEEWSLSASSKAGITSKNPHFVEILQPSHKAFIGKLLQTFSVEVRTSSLDDFFTGKTPTVQGGKQITPEQQQQQINKPLKYPVSKRLGSETTLLAKSLRATKIQIRDMELAILDDDDNDGGRRVRSSKRRKRS